MKTIIEGTKRLGNSTPENKRPLVVVKKDGQISTGYRIGKHFTTTDERTFCRWTQITHWTFLNNIKMPN